MGRTMKAAVCSAVNGGMVVEDVLLGDPGPDEVLVRIDAAGSATATTTT